MAINRVMAKAMPVYLVEQVTSEHFFEHLDAETEARAFFLECLRAVYSPKMSCVWSCQTRGRIQRTMGGAR